MIWNRKDMFLAVAIYINRIMVFAVLDDEYIHTPDRGENLGLELAVGKPGAFCRNLELRAFIGVNVFVWIKVIRIQNVGLQVYLCLGFFSRNAVCLCNQLDFLSVLCCIIPLKVIYNCITEGLSAWTCHNTQVDYF